MFVVKNEMFFSCKLLMIFQFACRTYNAMDSFEEIGVNWEECTRNIILNELEDIVFSRRRYLINTRKY